jgi:hypothetical protein
MPGARRDLNPSPWEPRPALALPLPELGERQFLDKTHESARGSHHTDDVLVAEPARDSLRVHVNLGGIEVNLPDVDAVEAVFEPQLVPSAPPERGLWVGGAPEHRSGVFLVLLVVNDAPVVGGVIAARDGQVEGVARLDREHGAVEVGTGRDVRGGPL